MGQVLEGENCLETCQVQLDTLAAPLVILVCPNGMPRELVALSFQPVAR